MILLGALFVTFCIVVAFGVCVASTEQYKNIRGAKDKEEYIDESGYYEEDNL